MSARKRPGPLRWLWYAVGGRLPARYDVWVLHDTTSSTWILRHVARCLVMLALPITALVIFLPTATGLKILTAFTAGGCGMMFMLVHIIETTERRLIRAGYPAGSAEATRHQRSIDSQIAGNAARRARNQARIDKRTRR